MSALSQKSHRPDRSRASADEDTKPFAGGDCRIDPLAFAGDQTPKVHACQKVLSRQDFFECLGRYWTAHGIQPDVAILRIDARTLDLYELSREVIHMGGFVAVQRNDLWTAISVKMGFPITPAAGSSQTSALHIGKYLKLIYERLLAGFESDIVPSLAVAETTVRHPSTRRITVSTTQQLQQRPVSTKIDTSACSLKAVDASTLPVGVREFMRIRDGRALTQDELKMKAGQLKRDIEADRLRVRELMAIQSRSRSSVGGAEDAEAIRSMLRGIQSKELIWQKVMQVLVHAGAYNGTASASGRAGYE